MADSKNTVKMVVLLVVIAAALGFVIKQAIPPGHPGVDWACESCDHAFVAPPQVDTRTCPRRGCGGEAVRSHIYYNEATGQLVEVYRERFEFEEIPGMDEELEIRWVKEPGGEWRRADMEMEAEIGFPVRVRDARNLRYAPPGSQYR